MTTALKTRFREKKCKQCGEVFTPDRPLQSVCGFDCVIAMNRAKQEKRKAKAEAAAKAQSRRNQKALRASLKLRKARLKTKTDWARDAQTAFNRFVRVRDAGKPCISCDRLDGTDHQRHASHYRSVKAAKQLRFNLWNVHASCAQCNTSDSGNILEYRIRLIKKIGTERVEALESNQELAKCSIEELKRIKTIFSKRARYYEGRRK